MSRLGAEGCAYAVEAIIANHATMPPSFPPPVINMIRSGTRQENWKLLIDGARRHLAAAALAWIAAFACVPARAATEIQLWHAMSGERGRQLGALIAQFNESQPDYKVVLVLKGGYSETVMSAIFAVRTRSHPAIVQVNEIGTATMMAAGGAIYPVYQLMRDQGEPFDPKAYLPAVAGYYTDMAGNMLSYPFNSSTPILYYNKELFRAAGLNENVPPATWPEVEKAGRQLRASGVRCGFTSHWPSWVHIENFSALHNIQLATRSNGMAGLDAELTINNPLITRHIAALAEWQKEKIFDYGGRATEAEPKFPSGECAMFIGSSGLRGDIIASARFPVGYGMLPYWPDTAGAPQNSIIGGATFWVLRNRPEDEYKGVAKLFTFLSQPKIQAAWHQSTGYLPITAAAYDLTRSQGFYERNPGTSISIKQITLKLPTENSKGLRLGSFVLIRDVIEDEIEQTLAGKKTAASALDSAVRRGNMLLRQFERANR
jgi:sn-glycerol 3-phosphate transport system substrate-binding protein